MRRFLGEFEQLLLLALSNAQDEMYGLQIQRVLERQARRRASPGALYTALDRLERRGLVSSRLGEPTPQRGGKRKRYYRIEAAGVRLLRESQRALARMSGKAAPEPGTS